MTRDSKGNTLDVMGGKSGIVKNTSGKIKLTLDSRIQQIVEWRLSEGAKAANAAWGAAVCVDPTTGAIMALASYPTVDPNNRKNL
ncbi:MAG: penicillin-binding protein 2, partial [Synergistaceae bacterium]